MAEDLTPVEVTAWTARSGTPCWTVAYERPDGSTHIHAFPQGTIEWRMAEYQLDSVDEALDIVLHEPWATDPMDPMQARDDAAVRVGMVTRIPGPIEDYDPIRLHNADTIDDARVAHRIRVADAKARVQIAPPAGASDPLDLIRSEHGVTPAGLQAKTLIVDQARHAYRGETASTAAPITPLDDTAQRRTLAHSQENPSA